MKTILIPTDFTVSSLNLVRDLLERLDNEEIHIILAHGVMLSSSISDLLFFSKEKLLAELNNNEFESAIHILYNKYQSKINRIQLDLVYSANTNYLNNYLEANNISKIYLPNTTSFNSSHKRSINLITALRKTMVPFEDLEWKETPNLEKNTITDLFFRKK